MEAEQSLAEGQAGRPVSRVSVLGARHCSGRAAWGIHTGLRNSHLASFVSPLVMWARSSRGAGADLKPSAGNGEKDSQR